MTITAFRLENFMAFADTGWIELRPITLLFGRNSSGKSAIIRALRLLRQSLNTPPDSPLRFVDEYGVDVGSYQEAVHRYNPTMAEELPQISFHFRCSIPTALESARSLLNEWRQNNNLPIITATKDDYLILAVAFGNDPDHRSELRNIQLGCSWPVGDESNLHLLLAAYRLSQEDRSDLGYEWQFSSDLPLFNELDWQRTTIEPTIGFLPDLASSPRQELEYIWTELCKTIRAFLKGIEYLGPIRPEPRRVYIFDEVTREQWQQRGWGRLLDFLEGNLDDEKLVKVDQWLRTLDLGEQIRPPAVTKDKDFTVAKIEIEEKGSKLPINLKNTGYGASQVIPIIIQCVTARQQARENTMVPVIIEQPELHLHPRAQAQLADLFVNEIYTLDLFQINDNGDPIDGYRQYSSITFLLETHSEHLLLRLQKRLIETAAELNKKEVEGRNRYLMLKDFNIYFTQRNKDLSTVEPIQLNELGEFTRFPDEFETFFADDLIEAGELAQLRLKARAKRR